MTAHPHTGSQDTASTGTGPGLATTIRSVVQQIVIPQGFTLSITGPIAIMNGHRCQAGPIAIWLFIVGAGIGYSTAGLASGAHHRLVSSRSQPQPITGLSVLSVVPVLVVPVAAGAAWWIPDPRVAFATAGFVATAGYVSAFALFLHLFTRQRDRRAARSRRGAAMLRAGPTSKP
jgi:hypothetical protein